MCLYPRKIRVKSFCPIGDDIETVVDFETGEHFYKCTIPVRCGKCLECLEQDANVWAHRCMDEASLYKDNCVITLTYNNRHLPAGGNLRRKDLQDFLKRLRSFLDPIKIRYFYCGEYGSIKNTFRPHYHIIIFGWKPDDLVFHTYSKKGSKLYKSKSVEHLWSKRVVLNGNEYFDSFGIVEIGEVDMDTCKYSAKYLQKLQCVPSYMVQPFTGMSNRPGIGYQKISSNSLLSDKIYHNGQFIKIPRYYLDKLELRGFDVATVKEVRLQKAIDFERSSDELIEARNFARKKVLDKDLNCIYTNNRTTKDLHSPTKL